MSADWFMTTDNVVVNLDVAQQISIRPEMDRSTLRAATTPAYYDIIVTMPAGQGVYHVALKRFKTEREAITGLNALGRNLELGAPPSFRGPTD